jgi:sulfatase modifying factor 1
MQVSAAAAGRRAAAAALAAMQVSAAAAGRRAAVAAMQVSAAAAGRRASGGAAMQVSAGGDGRHWRRCKCRRQRRGDGQRDTGGSNVGGSGGATGGTGGSNVGGSGGTTYSCDTCGSLEECWNGQYCVAKKVQVTGGYAIDATEVTRDQYAAWLATNPSTSGQPSYCSWNDGLHAELRMAAWGERQPPGGVRGLVRRIRVLCGGGQAVVRQDWRWGQRVWGLRGRDEEPMVQRVQFGRAERLSVWGYVLGSTCNGYDAGKGGTVPVGSMSGCESSVSGYTGVYDLSGNVWEWEDSCDGYVDDTNWCRLRGGSFNDVDYYLRCEAKMTAVDDHTFGSTS